MRSSEYTFEQRYKRLKRRFIAMFAFFMLLTGVSTALIYANLDYIVFKYLFSKHYIYTETLDHMFEQEVKRDVRGKYYTYFDNVVISQLTRNIRSMNADKYTYLYFPEKFTTKKPDRREPENYHEIVFLTSDTVYLRLSWFCTYTYEFIKGNKEHLQKYSNIIIDLRDSSEGDPRPFTKIAGIFLPNRSIINVKQMRLADWTGKSLNRQPLTFKRVIILQNRRTEGVPESFIAALKDNLDNVTVLGETTMGNGAGQLTVPLKRGFAIRLTTMLFFSPDNNIYHEKGLLPDIEYAGNDIVDYVVKNILR